MIIYVYYSYRPRYPVIYNKYSWLIDGEFNLISHYDYNIIPLIDLVSSSSILSTIMNNGYHEEAEYYEDFYE